MIPLQRIFHRDENQDRISYQSMEAEELAREDTPEPSVNLNPAQATRSAAQNYILRHWHYTNFAARFALWGVKHKAETSSLIVKPPARLFWLSGEGVPLEDWSKIRLAHVVKDFFNHASFFVCGLEPAILAGLLLHDLSSYGFSPDERCGTSFSAILGGTASNQITWTNHFGSDVLHEAAYWTWTGTLLLPPIASLITAIFKDKRRERWRDINHQVSLHNFSVLDSGPSIYNDMLVALSPWSSLRGALAHAKFLILWEGRKHNDANTPLVSFTLKQALVNKLIELAHPSRGFPLRFQVLRLLAQIANSFHVNNVEYFIEDPLQKINLVQLRETILTALKSASLTRQSLTFLPIEGIQASIEDSIVEEDQASTPLIEPAPTLNKLNRYFTWTLGETSRPLTPLFFIPSLLSSLYTLYAVGRYLQLIIQKATDLSEHQHAKANCEAEGNSFTFLQQSDRYECVACDWSFVNYQNMFTAQACLDSLLQQSMMPEELLHHLNQLPNAGGITRIDLSQQAWPTWVAADWEQLLITLQSMVTSPLEFVNFSGPAENNVRVEPSQQHIQALARFLTSINVTHFDISNQLLNDELFNLLLHSLSEINLSELNLVNTNMTDVSVISLANLISNELQHLNNLQLTGNQITDLGVQHISEALSNSLLLILNLAKNSISDLGLQKLAQGIQHSFVHTLDLSDQQFSANGLRLFSDTLKGNSSLRVLKISNAALEGEHITALQACLENLESLDVSSNSLEDQDIEFLIKLARNSRLKSLNIAGNELSDQAAMMMAEHLPATSLRHLDISGSELSQHGFSALVKVMPNTQLLSFVCESTELNDHDIAELTTVFSNRTLLLRSLNLNGNEITHNTLMNWLDVLPKSNLRELRLNKNKISNRLAPGLAEALSKTKLTVLDLSSNLLDGNFFNELAPVLHQSRLQQLILNDNRVEETSLNNFAKELVQLSCHANDLNTTQLSRQAKRVFYPMKSDTQLTQLNIMHDDLDAPTIRSFCRVASSLPDVRFLQSDQLQRLDWRTCEMLPTNTIPVVRLDQPNGSQSNQSTPTKGSTLLLGSPFLMSLLCAGGILCLVALLYGGYRASRSTYRFFRPAPERLPLIGTEYTEINNDNGRPSRP